MFNAIFQSALIVCAKYFKHTAMFDKTIARQIWSVSSVLKQENNTSKERSEMWLYHGQLSVDCRLQLRLATEHFYCIDVIPQWVTWLLLRHPRRRYHSDFFLRQIDVKISQFLQQ